MTSATLIANPSAPAETLLSDLASMFTEERLVLHFICSRDGSFVSAFSSRDRALEEWEHLCTNHKNEYCIYHEAVTA